jgi:hypothetical protein
LDEVKAPDQSENSINDINRLAFYHLIRWNLAEATVVYQDYGISPGMEYGIKLAKERGIPIEYRSIGQNGSGDGEPPA